MPTQQINKGQWTQFLNDFSRAHEGQTATVEAFGPGTGAHHEARALPFGGFEVETKEPGHIIVMLGTETDDHISHTVTSPVQVWHKAGPDEANEVVEIRSEDGIGLVIKFAPPQG